MGTVSALHNILVRTKGVDCVSMSNKGVRRTVYELETIGLNNSVSLMLSQVGQRPGSRTHAY